MSFELLVIALVAGLVLRAFIGVNPIAVAGSVQLFLLIVVGLLPFASPHDPNTTLNMAMAYTERLTNALPSIVMGQLAGLFAKEIFAFFQGIVDDIAG